jgi:hypothetical protein
MKKLALIITIIMNFSASMACDDPIFRFITVNNDTISINKSDIDSLGSSSLILTEDAVIRIKNIESIISEVYFFNEFEEWEQIYITDMRSAARHHDKYLFTNSGSLFFWSKRQLVYEGLVFK